MMVHQGQVDVSEVTGSRAGSRGDKLESADSVRLDYLFKSRMSGIETSGCSGRPEGTVGGDTR
jgi:hypothetical protein